MIVRRKLANEAARTKIMIEITLYPPINVEFKIKSFRGIKILLWVLSTVSLLGLFLKTIFKKKFVGGTYIVIDYNNSLNNRYSISKMFLGYKHSPHEGKTYRNMKYV